MASIPNSNSNSTPTAPPAQATAQAAAPQTTNTNTTPQTTTTKTNKPKSKTKTVTKTTKTVKARKKTTTTTTTTSTAQTAWNQAKLAQADLARQKAQQEARQMDPLWYRMEDIVSSTSTSSSNSGETAVLPEQAQLIEQVLSSSASGFVLTCADVTPQAMTCLLELSRRYANELIRHAQDFALAANRVEVLEKDLQLAAKMRTTTRSSFSSNSLLHHTTTTAAHVNRQPLPPIPSQCITGVLLPPKPHQLTARTYDVVSGARVQRKMILKVPQAPKPPKLPVSASSSSYGASQGRTIPIVIRNKTAVAATSTTTSTSMQAPTAQTTTSVAPSPSTSKVETPVPMNVETTPVPMNVETPPVPMNVETPPVPMNSTDTAPMQEVQGQTKESAVESVAPHGDSK